MTEAPQVIRSREDVYRVWDKRSVVIREQAVGSTIVYPQLPRGVTYQNYTLREGYILASLQTISEGILWCDHHYYGWSVLGPPSPSLDNES